MNDRISKDVVFQPMEPLERPGDYLHPIAHLSEDRAIVNLSHWLAWLTVADARMLRDWLSEALPVETKALQEPAGIPTRPDLWDAVSHLLSHWDEHRKCFEICGTTMTELREAFAASAATGHACPPEEATG